MDDLAHTPHLSYPDAVVQQLEAHLRGSGHGDGVVQDADHVRDQDEQRGSLQAVRSAHVGAQLHRSTGVVAVMTLGVRAQVAIGHKTVWASHDRCELVPEPIKLGMLQRSELTHGLRLPGPTGGTGGT